MKFRFKPFQARLVACWLVSMPLTWLFVIANNRLISRLATNPLAAAMRELEKARNESFITFFWRLLVTLVVLSFLIEFIAKLLRSTTIDSSTDPVDNA